VYLSVIERAGRSLGLTVGPPNPTDERGLVVSGAGQAHDPEEAVRAAAGTGSLPQYLKNAPPRERAALHRIVSQLVYDRVTRPVERRRGHRHCASSPDQLEPDCHDRHQDDVRAVYEYLMRHATVPIASLEAWLVPRLRPSTVDAHRRRRGERGAQQRPRLPGWLTKELDHDPWLQRLAIEILTWVGVSTTAGFELWPLSAWADRRATVTGDPTSNESQVARDVERVLAAMRRRRPWYERFVERPLGRKQAPVLPAPTGDHDAAAVERQGLALVPAHEVDDARLLELAGEAVTAITTRIRHGEDARSAVLDVLEVVFGSGTGAECLDRSPGAAPAEDEYVATILADRATVDRIVVEILKILDGG